MDVVTARQANLYADLIDFLGQSYPMFGQEAPSTYAAACRWRVGERRAKWETWSHVLAVGRTLPTLPLWLSPTRVIPLDLEESYEKTCDDLSRPIVSAQRIPKIYQKNGAPLVGWFIISRVKAMANFVSGWWNRSAFPHCCFRRHDRLSHS